MQEFNLKKDSLKSLAYELLSIYRKEGMPVFLCVGSDKFVSDSLAPIIAEKLKKEFNIRAYVYGGLDYNINAHNLVGAINYIETEHPHNVIFLIDATLGENVGHVRLTRGSYPASGKCLPIKKMGEYSILGVVGKNSARFDLNSTRLKLVMQLSDFISSAIAISLRYYLEIDNRGLKIAHN